MASDTFWQGVGGKSWRAVVGPDRRPRIARIPKRKSLPGQLLLFSIETSDAVAQGEEETDEWRSIQEGIEGSTTAIPSTSYGAEVTCPNCGGTEFDADGDCTRCWEPGVVSKGRRHKLATPEEPGGRARHRRSRK